MIGGYTNIGSNIPIYYLLYNNFQLTYEINSTL